MAEVAAPRQTAPIVAELEDTATSSTSKAEDDGPPEYTHDKDNAQQPAASLEKEALSFPDEKHLPAITPGKEVANATSDEKRTVLTSSAPGEAGKEVVSEPRSTHFTSPTSSSMTNTSHGGLIRQPSRSYREYSFWHTAPWRPTHNVITDPESTGRYFIEVSEFSKGKQDVTIHDIAEGGSAASLKGDSITADEGKAAPVVAFAQFPSGNSNLVRLGLGDPNTMAAVKWINMTTEPDSKDWALFVPVRDTTKVYHFRSTKSMPASSDAELATPSTVQSSQTFSASPIVGNYKFTDGESNTTLAIYSENKLAKTWKKRGKLRIYERDRSLDMSVEEQELLVVLCCAVTNEKRRRKNWKKWVLIG